PIAEPPFPGHLARLPRAIAHEWKLRTFRPLVARVSANGAPASVNDACGRWAGPASALAGHAPAGERRPAPGAAVQRLCGPRRRASASEPNEMISANPNHWMAYERCMVSSGTT